MSFRGLLVWQAFPVKEENASLCRTSPLLHGKPLPMRYDASLPASERKRHGVFYTPEPVVRYLLRATAPAGPVADLSCGDGAFLVEAARAGLPVMGIERDPEALARAEAALAASGAERRLHCG